MTKKITTGQIALMALVLIAALAATLMVSGNSLGVVQEKSTPTLWEHEEVLTSTVPAATLTTETPSLLDTLPTAPGRVEKPSPTPSLTPTEKENTNGN